jgi:hypothetical protein
MNNVTTIGICPVCGGGLHMLDLFSGAINYFCESDYCTLSPYTRYSITYDDNKILISIIILDINNIHYRLSNYYDLDGNGCTVIGTLHTFLQQTNGTKFDKYVFNMLSKFDYMIPWDNALSAYNVITRILKIKAFA